MVGEVAPAAADVEDPHARLQLELAAEQFQLRGLGLVQIPRLGPVAAGVGHAPIEHHFKEVVAEVVVLATDAERAKSRLAIDESREQGRGEHPPPGGQGQGTGRGRETLVQVVVQSIRIPRPVHVRLAQPHQSGTDRLGQRHRIPTVGGGRNGSGLLGRSVGFGLGKQGLGHGDLVESGADFRDSFGGLEA